MIPLLPFGLGLAAGAVIVGILKKKIVPQDLEKTKEGVRKMAVKGLSTIETAAANLKEKISAGESEKSEDTTKTRRTSRSKQKDKSDEA